ncbi:hypothetical protein OBBRIDRAFT_886644 [Obba rivulosa]|uniref:Uncharacterized protein n=1 Tax=Obba rivulosa TaxID=1052685 RepID=A0A8E2B416_9APHY|nr:hypothetical protein OBBRIDRAFT_886644 [Obba rivulosa]
MVEWWRLSKHDLLDDCSFLHPAGRCRGCDFRCAEPLSSSDVVGRVLRSTDRRVSGKRRGRRRPRACAGRGGGADEDEPDGREQSTGRCSLLAQEALKATFPLFFLVLDDGNDHEDDADRDSSPSLRMTSRASSSTPLVRALFSTEPDDASRRLSRHHPRVRTSSFTPPAASPRDPFTAHPAASASFVTFDPPPTPDADASPSHHGTFSALAALPKRARGSILLATSSLSFPRPLTRPRKKSPAPATPNPLLFTEVIEISAPPREIDEDEERSRLRDAAAQSLGIDPDLVDEPPRRILDDYDDRQDGHEDYSNTALADSLVFDARRPSVASTAATSSSAVAPVAPDTGASLPPFPALHAALEPFAQFSARIPKYHPPPSIFALALSRQWKLRHLVLTVSPSSPSPSTSPISPLFPGSSIPQAPSPVPSSPPITAHLHVFKSSAPDARELERLPISADSVAFLSDTPVAGRAAVRVRGASGTEWALAAPPAEAQTWIEHIKGVVLSQRSVRAGLGAVTPNLRGIEPRGDLDVMLSLRAQTLFSAPISPSSSRPSTAAQPPPASTAHRPAPSTSSTPSLRSVVTATNTATHGTLGYANGSASGSATPHVSRPQSPAVAALRGLFSGRPRSPSTATVSSSHGTPAHSVGPSTDEVASILGVLESAVPPSPVLPSMLVERKILEERERERVVEGLTSEDEASVDSPGAGLAIGMSPSMSRRANPPEGPQPLQLIPRVDSPSLQPPPRRRAWTSSGVPMGPRAMHTTGNGHARGQGSMYYTHGNASTAESFGLHPVLGSPLLMPEREPQRPRTSTSTSSVSAASVGSGERRTSLDWSPKRWSRQGKIPSQLTPPSGPPPAVPAMPSPSTSTVRTSLSVPRHPYAEAASISTQPSASTLTTSSNTNAGGVSGSSSIRSSATPQSIIGSLGLQTFSKRASNASVQSISTLSSNTTQSHAPSAIGGTSKIGQRPRSSHRNSVPPPQRPAPSAALPPTPTPSSPTTSAPPEDTNAADTSSPQSQKMSFRESLALRSKRFSLSPPTQPPSSDLPPRPDELTLPSSPTRANWERHRRCASNGNTPSLYPISASPSPPPTAPPPSSSLPLTPASEKENTIISPNPSPVFKIGRRLRMRSAPAPSLPPSAAPPAQPPSPAPSTINPYLLPPTPIGEPILAQNDPQLLLTTSPPTPPPRPSEHPPPPEASPELHGITSLSPPPRKGSKRGIAQFREEDDRRPATADASVQAHPLTPLSLSPQLSAVSLVDVRF